MATVIGDVFTDSSRLHTMIGGPSVQHQHSRDTHFQSRSTSRSRDREVHPHPSRPATSPRRQGSGTTASIHYPSHSRRDWDDTAPGATTGAGAKETPTTQHHLGGGGASRFPSPPSSSSPSETASADAHPPHGTPGCAPAVIHDAMSGSLLVTSSVSSASSASTATTVIAAHTKPIPSPDSDTSPTWNSAADAQPALVVPASLPLDNDSSSPIQTQTTIRVRDLAHIQSLAREDLLTAAGPGILNDPPLQQMKYEISAMPIGDIIEMVAALLTKITTTNDLQHDALNRNAAHVRQAQAQARNEDGSGDGMSPQSSSVLAFHGKNVPAITILSYLSRIHKYCPTTYEVFLSLLVYFDRMTERVNDMVMKSEEARRLQLEAAQSQPPQAQYGQSRNSGARISASRTVDTDTVMHDDDSQESDETDSDLADDDDDDGVDESPVSQRSGRTGSGGAGTIEGAPVLNANINAASGQGTYFVVDSFNIHRLIIAGVTCASKFFSDVFYTNSRYAKVGGLPLAELNHLELQFLILNDFRLAVPVEDLEAYATMLVEFYAREVVSQRSRPVTGMD
ncbi:cyclin-domain-containing protein [Lasiosphaeria ovina]|uniref:Cyclin-domain-containing protein n=1 Tax=Lasiosphaeria ovina TaxID=92902 RepID=A0AAE0KIK9_9PEZI|nr:cyclin-domain-containing protein [Lasiosphaeria ovina]